MSQRTATIESLPMAFEVVKAMRADGLAWGEGYRPLGRQALAEIIETYNCLPPGPCWRGYQYDPRMAWPFLDRYHQHLRRNRP